MVVDLHVTFAGVEIKNPIIIASSPLTESAEAIFQCEKHGAGAVIAKSCSSTRLDKNGYRRCLIDEKGWWAASTYNREIQDVHDAAIYLTNAVKGSKIPVFASVSELSLDCSEWLNTCQIVQRSGVAGIQLDLFYFENALGVPMFQEKFVELLSTLKSKLDVPIFPKLNINLPTQFMVNLFKGAGINDVSLLDSVSLPAPISINKSGSPKLRFASNIKRASLFGAWQFPLTMKYLYDLQLGGFSICAGGGIKNSSDIIELLLLGAQAVQIATAIILEGYLKIKEFITGIESFMIKNNFQKITDIRGVAISHFSDESDYINATVKFNKALCTGCNNCISQGFCNAISRTNGVIEIDKNLCEGCSLCVELCPSKALYME